MDSHLQKGLQRASREQLESDFQQQYDVYSL